MSALGKYISHVGNERETYISKRSYSVSSNCGAFEFTRVTRWLYRLIFYARSEHISVFGMQEQTDLIEL